MLKASHCNSVPLIGDFVSFHSLSLTRSYWAYRDYCATMFKTEFCILSATFTTLLMTSSYGFAQSLTDHEKRVKQGLDRLESQIAPLQKREDVFLQEDVRLPEPAVTAEDDRCFQVNGIEVSGASQLNSRALAKVISSYTDKCLSLQAINTLVETLSNLYLDAGLVTSRAYLQPQNLADGVLEILVIEGFAEELQAADGSLSASEMEYAFPDVKTGVLNLRDIEQGLENLNSLAKNSAKVDLQPGATQGGTLVVINNQLSEDWRGSVGINNSGTPDTSLYQVDANLVFDNPFGISDNLFFSGSRNLGGHDLPTAHSASYASSWSFPAGYWRFLFQNNYFEYEQSVIGSNVNFLTHGSSFNSTIAADKTLYRGKADKLDSGLSLTRKKNKNYIEDVFLDTSSREIYVLDFGVNYLTHKAVGTFNFGLHLNRSVSWFGAKSELATAEDDFQFTKYLATLGFSTQTQWGDQPVYFNSALEWLYSPKVIIASEGLSVGGRYSVRGISETSLFGYKGAYVRNDLSLPLTGEFLIFNRNTLYLGLDAGMTNLPEFDNQDADWISGAIVGIRFGAEKTSLHFAYARTVRVPDFLPAKQQEMELSIRYNF